MAMRIPALMAAIGLCLGAQAASAFEITGSAALSLAARVGDRSPLTSLWAKGLLGVYLDGRPTARYLGSGKIEVKADSVQCRIGNVDITARHCSLTFGAKTVSVKGRSAQALYATLVEAGIPQSGAAGLTGLLCTIDPAEVRRQAGGGATCTFTASP
jgi:hypothetical protein